jgi:hypothetical protein
MPLRMPRSTHPGPADLPDLIRELLAELRALRSDLLAHQRAASGPRDDADVHLLITVATECGSRVFTARDLWRHADVAPDLAAALEAADLTTAVEVGHWLQRMAGAPVSGFTVVRGRRGSSGRTWSVQPA